jgi:NAD(P)-dependent dehydrogenase (short-subunit alcohol dehydrogenase family)
MRIVITGSNRGIGLELVRQCLARGDTVFAAARNPDAAPQLQALRTAAEGRLTIVSCDVSDDSIVKRLPQWIPSPIDALINNAGVYGEQAPFEKLDLDAALKVFSTNALGPLRVTRALLPHLRAGKTKKVLHVTSGMGSIEDNRSGGSYAYRMSKAALNMGARSFAMDFKSEGILSAVISPGWVKTDMGGSGAPTSVEDSAWGILSQLEQLNEKTSGEFLDFAGKHWDW